MKDKIEAAKKAGYSDEQIAQAYAKKDPRIGKALEAGYEPQQILSRLETNPEKAKESKYFGNEGSLVGGKVGRAIETAVAEPSQLLKETPTAALKTIEGLTSGIPTFQALKPLEALAGLFNKNPLGAVKAGSQMPSEAYSEKARENLPEELKIGAEDIADIEEFLIPFLQFKKASKLKGSLGKIGSAAEEAAAIKKPTAPFQEGRAAIMSGEGSPNLRSLEVPQGASTFLEEEKILEALNEPSLGQKSISETRISEPGRSLEGRISKEAKDSGLRPAPVTKQPHIEDEVGGVFSDKIFENSRSGGKGVVNEIRNLDDQIYKTVNENYSRSRELNKGIEAVHPELVEKLQDRLAKLEEIPELSTPEKKLKATLKKITKRLAEFDEAGNAVGFKPISNQTLIEQNQSLRKIIDYDFAHGDANNIFRPTIGDIQFSVEKAAAKNPEALESLKTASSSYKDWVQRFDNDYVRPLRNKSNHDYSKMYNGFLDLDEFNYLRNVLKESPQGQVLERGLARSLAEKRLAPHLKDVRSSDPRALEKELRELSSFSSPEEIDKIKEIVRKNQARVAPRKATDITSSKVPYKTPEDIQKSLNSRSGIRELKKRLKDSGNENLFTNYADKKVSEIFREGKIGSKKLKGQDIYNIVNDKKNYEILSELIGEDVVKDILSHSKKAAGEAVTEEFLTKAFSKLAKKSVGAGILKTIIGIIL